MLAKSAVSFSYREHSHSSLTTSPTSADRANFCHSSNDSLLNQVSKSLILSLAVAG